MRAAPGRLFDLAGLVRIAGVSERTLQRQFHKLLGKSPLSVLTDIRFENARRQLLRAAPGGTVSEIALRSGFTHLGRFSVEYARRYAEKPSQTLRRQLPSPTSAAPPNILFSTARDRPTIVIARIDTSEQNREIASSLTDDLAIALTGSGLTVTEAARSARYRLHGSLRGEAPALHFTARLVDAHTACLIWAHKLDAPVREGFLFAEHVAETIATVLQPVLRGAEVRRAYRKADSDVTANDLALRALPHAVALNFGGNSKALDLLGQALARDPDSPLAIALVSWCHAQCATYHFGDVPAYHRGQALTFARRLADLDGDAMILAILGNTFALMNEIEMADLVTRKALGLCGCAHFEAGNFPRAVEWFERAVVEHPTAAWPHELLCPAYFYSGREAETRRSLAALHAAYPALTVPRVVNGMSFFTQRFRDRIANGLEAVGL